MTLKAQRPRTNKTNDPFAFRVARPLYKNNVHPRLLIGPHEVVAMRQRTRKKAGRAILAAMQARLDPLIDGILAAPDEATAISVVAGAYFARSLWYCLDEIAALGLLKEDQRPLLAVRRVLLALATTPQKDGTPHNPIGSLSIIANGYDLAHASLSKADLASITPWILEHGIRLPLVELRAGHYRCAGANTPLVRMLSALFLTLAIEGDAGVPDLTAQRDELLKMFEATMHVVRGADGYPAEDIGYGTGVTAYLTQLAEALRRAGHYDAYSECPRFARFSRAILHFVQPWGEHLTSTGDHYDAFVERAFVLGRQAKMTRDGSAAWLAMTLRPSLEPFTPTEVPAGKNRQLPASWLTLAVLDDFKPVHPGRAGVPTQFVDRTRGLVSFRSSWDDDALYVTLDGSQFTGGAAGHQHASCGHFNLSALGDYFAIDAGRYNVEQSCHNVVLINGQSGRSTDGQWRASWHDGRLTGYAPGSFVDTASVNSTHQHDCYWARRTLGLVKGDVPYVWIVDDLNKNHDWCGCWWQLHSSPENKITLGESSATIKGWRRGNLLDVYFFLPDPSLYPKPHTMALEQDEAVSSSSKYVGDSHSRIKQFARPSDMLHRSVFVRPRLLAKISGYEGRIFTLLIPRRAGEPPARVERLPSLTGTFVVRVAFRGIEDTVAWAYDHSLLESPAGVHARGQWRVERRRQSTGRVMAQAGSSWVENMASDPIWGHV